VFKFLFVIQLFEMVMLCYKTTIYSIEKDKSNYSSI